METYLDHNLICRNCGEKDLFLVEVVVRFDISVSGDAVVVDLDDVEIEQGFADRVSKVQRQEFDGWIVCGRCGSEDIVKRFEENPLNQTWYSPFIPAEDVRRAAYYVRQIKEDNKHEAEMHKSKL